MKILKKSFYHLFVILFIIMPFLVGAQSRPVTPPTTGTTQSTNISVNIPNPAEKAGNSIPALITTLLNNVVMPIAAVAVVIWIVYAGFTFVTAQGKESKISEAKSRLLWSLIGAGILLGAAAISKVVENTVKGLL